MGAPFFHERDEIEGAMLADKYFIVRRIGRGGMGSVYEGTHVLMDRKVAIKVVRTNYAQADPACLARFKLEAKASSRLNHPNIMTVYDFGITELGLAYLVMDYIDGVGLDVILNKNSDQAPDVNRIVEIFSQACQALAHAHDKGVVHRDLKPSNLMLTKDEAGKDLVKIVDFGIAKMLAGRARSAEAVNDGGQVIGSPLYMSPEQCLGDDQDGRSDIYSLGCLLYEALTGSPPIADNHVLGIMYKHMKECPKPFATIAPENEIPAALEAIVMKALAKDPKDRHQSMKEMANELQLAQAANPGLRSQVHAEHASDATQLVFSSHDRVPAYKELQDESLDSVEQHFIRQVQAAAERFGAQSPEVVPTIHHLADYYIFRGRLSRAERQLRAAIELLVDLYGPWDSRVADSVLQLAELYRTGGRPFDAEPLYLDLVAIKKANGGETHPDMPFLTLRLSELYLSTGRLHDAYKYYCCCLRSSECIYGEDDPVLSAIIVGLAAVLLQLGKLKEAASLYQRALELNALTLGMNHPTVIGPLISLGVAYRRLENWQASENALHRAIAVHRANFDGDTSEICHAYWMLAENLSYHQRHSEAETLYEHVLNFFHGQSGNDEALAQLHNAYGAHFLRKRQLQLAEKQFLQALKIRERSFGKFSSEVAASLNLIASVYHAYDKLELAEEYYQRSLTALSELEDTAELASENLKGLGDLYMSQNRFTEAQPAYMKALQALKLEQDPKKPIKAHTQQIIDSLSKLHRAANGPIVSTPEETMIQDSSVWSGSNSSTP